MKHNLKSLALKLLGRDRWHKLNSTEIALLLLSHPIYCLPWWLGTKKEQLKKFINSLCFSKYFKY